MQIRLIGAPDLVRAWAADLARSYGIVCREYPSRRDGNDLRIYADLDDRLAAKVVGLDDAGAAPLQNAMLSHDRLPAAAPKRIHRRKK